MERIAAVAPVVVAAADEAERGRRLPAPLLDALHDTALFRLLLPRWLDGDELDPARFVAAIEALGALDASTAWCVGQATVCSLAAAYLARDRAATVFGDRRAVLAWGPDVGTHAVPVEGGYVVTGRWMYVSGIHHADWLGGSCKLFDADGAPRLTAAGAQAVRTLLFPARHATVTETWDTVGLRATGTDSFTVTDLFVPAELTFAREEVSTRVDPAPLYCFPHGTMFSAGLAAVVLGIGRGAVDALVSLARDKTPLGRERAMRDSPVVQSLVARLEARLRAARAYLLSTVEDAYRQATSQPEVGPEARTAIRLATSYVFEEAARVVDLAYHEAGITAVFTGNAFERRLRDIRTATQQFQGRGDHYEAVGKTLIGPP
jgi:indole-3-acetate monooxygenase